MPEMKSYLCPCCDKSITPDTKICPQCNQAVALDAHSVATMPMPLMNTYLKGYTKALEANPADKSVNGYMGMIFLRLKLYDKAMPYFETAIEDNYDSAEPYFMAAICLLRGKKPFLAQRADIDHAIEYLNAANMIAPQAIYYQLLGYIKQDYFDRKYLNVSPSSAEEYSTAGQLGLTEADVSTLNTLLGLQ